MGSAAPGFNRGITIVPTFSVKAQEVNWVAVTPNYGNAISGPVRFIEAPILSWRGAALSYSPASTLIRPLALAA
jgi:hypothetical protein